MDWPRLMSKGRALNHERQAPAILERRLVNIGAIAPIGPTKVVAASLDDDARASSPPILQGSPLA